MNHLPRPNHYSAIVALAAIGAAGAFLPPAILSQATEVTQILMEPNPLLFSSSPGYLGVLVGDVDNESAAKLKLKEVRGAVVTLIDHDAPAGQILKVNDVVLELNGQPVEGAEQLRRMLHEVPPGRKITMLISRDGVEQTLTTQMGDQKKIEKSVWMKMSNGGDVLPAAGPGNSILPGGDTVSGSGWRFSIFASSLKVGAMVEPLTSQMAEYLGVPSGLMVKQVAHKTEADAAGLKAFDVILKVGNDTIATTADWERSLHANQGKPVQVTILRDRKQQTITMQVDSKHNKGELDMEELFPSDDSPMLAGLASQELNVDPQAAAEGLRKQAETLRDSMKDFKIDPKLTEELKRQMDGWKKSFDPEQFKFDQKQLDEWKKQMDEWRDTFQPEIVELDPQWI